MAATDGRKLFVHGGFAWAAAPAVVSAVGVWADPCWKEAAGPEVAFAGDAVAVRAGPWAVVLPADRSARFPRYREVLTRLRVPAARVVLADADAAAWEAAVAGWAAEGGPDGPVVLPLGDPPTLARGGRAAPPHWRRPGRGTSVAGPSG